MGKKILFFAYYFPPSPLIAAIRTGEVARGLARQGWDVVVITVKLPITEICEKTAKEFNALGVKVIYVESCLKLLLPGVFGETRGWSNFVGKVLRKVFRVLNIEYEIGWLYHAYQASARVGLFDYVLASGGPWSSFLLAYYLHRTMGSRYVLDYRDLWWGNPHARWKKYLNLEKKIYKNAAGVIVVSKSMRLFHENLFGPINGLVITNGYSMLDIGGCGETDFDFPAIVYAGQFYPPIRGVESLFSALNMCKKAENDEFRFYYYGPSSEYVKDMAKKHEIEDVVVCCGNVSRHCAISAQRAARLVVVVVSESSVVDLAEAGIVTGKIFEAIALGVQTLVIAPKNSDVRSIVGGCKNIHVFAASELNEMADLVRKKLHSKSEKVDIPSDLSWDCLSRQYASFLENALRLERK